MSQADLELAELRESLSRDANGQRLAAMTARLTDSRATISRKLDGGVAAAEFEALNSMKQAYDTGLELLPKLWDQFNSRN